MSDRLTPEWTESLDEAFGINGTKGREGEEFLCKVFDSWGWSYELHHDDKKMQVAGIDITFKSPKWHNSYTCDVKANMDKYGSFYVYEDWLFDPRKINDRIFHVNPDTGWLCWYDRKVMQDWFDRSNERIKITAKTRPSFITARKYKGDSNENE